MKASVLIVSYNTQRLLGRCVDAARASAGREPLEIVVVDNGSRDGSADYIREAYPDVVLVESGRNLGFGKANNLGLASCSGDYVVLLNSDAFMRGDSLAEAIRLMDERPDVGAAGCRLVGEDGAWQPSARGFPGLLNDLSVLSGLAARYKGSRLFGGADMTHRDQDREMECDWVTGAFMIVRRSILDRIGFFDERFFLYFEEVDLCRRIKQAGWRVAYWPSVSAVHLGGASTDALSKALITKNGKQMGLWRLQSQYLYYRKHHGWPKAFASMAMESAFNALRTVKNARDRPDKAAESRVMLWLIRRAWRNTRGGRESPPRPWLGAEA